MSVRRFILAALASLCSCQVPTDPQKGPIVLQCVGIGEINGMMNMPDGLQSQVYLINGLSNYFAQWDTETKAFKQTMGKLAITTRNIQVSYASRNDDVTTFISLDIDRVSGRITERSKSTVGDMGSFRGKCLAIRDAKHAKSEYAPEFR